MQVFEDRVAVVTGGGSGIGRETCLALAVRGCDVAVVDISTDGAQETAALVERLGRRATVHRTDVADLDAMLALADAVRSEHGGCNVVVNNAGVTMAGSFEEDPVEDMAWMVGINVWGVVHGCRAFLPLLREADEGHIVNISSMAGLLGLPQNAVYSLTKGAVRLFSEGLRSELISTSIGVTVVMPGAIDTNIIASARGSQAERLSGLSSGVGTRLLTSPRTVARRIVRGIQRDRARVVVGPDAHLMSLSSRLVPGRSGLIGRAVSLVT